MEVRSTFVDRFEWKAIVSKENGSSTLLFVRTDSLLSKDRSIDGEWVPNLVGTSHIQDRRVWKKKGRKDGHVYSPWKQRGVVLPGYILFDGWNTGSPFPCVPVQSDGRDVSNPDRRTREWVGSGGERKREKPLPHTSLEKILSREGYEPTMIRSGSFT